MFRLPPGPDREKFLRKLSWFVLENMNKSVLFCDAFAEGFSDEEVREFDELTDILFQNREGDNPTEWDEERGKYR